MTLGDLVRDKVTGFTGRALAHKTGLYEADEWRVHPESLTSADGAPTPFIWFEEGRLELVDAHVRLVGFVTVDGVTT